MLGTTGAKATEVTLGFEGPPAQPSGTSYLLSQYDEDGYHVQPLGPLDTAPPYRMGRVGPASTNRPNNGGTHLSLAYGGSWKVTRSDSAPFDALRIDLAEYSTVFPTPQSFTFTGRKSDSSTISVTFTTDGVIDGTGSQADFQTFSFPNTFRGLVSLETTSLGAFDDLTVQLAAPVSPPPDPEPEIPTRWMQSPITLTGQVEVESAFISGGLTRSTQPTLVRFGNAQLLEHLVRAGRLPAAAGWSLRCIYDARLTELTTGPFSFAAVNLASGERIPLDGFLSIESLAQVMNGRLRVSPDSRGGYGRITEERFYRVDLTLSDTIEIQAYGRLPLQLTVATETGEQVAVVAPFVFRTSGHADLDALATLTLSVGKFTRFVPAAP